MPENVFMPDGTLFPFWDDTTQYQHTYHVACQHPSASDDGPGSEGQPFATINRAAQVLQPGERVIVHGGVYRECVRPARGGLSASQMIAYESVPGETAILRGSRTWKPAFVRGEGWSYGNAPVWVGDLPAEWFIGYNPFVARNFSSEFTTFTSDWSREEIHPFLLRRGMVFADGRPLRQVYFPADLAEATGVFWVEEPGLRLHLRLWDDADPNRVEFEVTTLEQIFAPLVAGLGYIRVSGLRFEYAADGVPVPQRAMVSANRGHHWIVEDNILRWANSTGIDVGNETWHRQSEDGRPVGGHIIRRNHVSDCGVCGIAAVGNNAQTLVEDNTVERIGGLCSERLWETGGLKFHLCDTVLIRRNVFRHIRQAPGLWLDYLNHNTRVSGNVFADIQGIHGGIYLEVSHAPNMLDHNIIWDVRGGPPYGRGMGIDVDTGEQCVVAHNLLGKIQSDYGVTANLDQKDRIVGGRVGLCRDHKVLNNLFVACPKRIQFARTTGNRSDGNLFDAHDDEVSLCIDSAEQKMLLNLDAWQRFAGFDTHSQQLPMQAEFDPETLTLTLDLQGEPAYGVPVVELYGEWHPKPAGPVVLQSGRQVYQIRAGASTG